MDLASLGRSCLGASEPGMRVGVPRYGCIICSGVLCGTSDGELEDVPVKDVDDISGICGRGGTLADEELARGVRVCLLLVIFRACQMQGNYCVDLVYC